PIIVINTHYHWDHIWGNSAFRDSIIISQRQCRDLILEKWVYMMNRNGSFCNGAAELCLPSLVFDKELYFPEDKIRLFHTPGHTADSISVLDEEEGVLNVGDNIGDTMDEIIPSIDTDMEQYIDTLRKYQTLDFDTCISGHNFALPKDVIDKIYNLVQE
ncbi:MAG: MBL fold metallo-hydrolase, partial [Mobilitalea sp.]